MVVLVGIQKFQIFFRGFTLGRRKYHKIRKNRRLRANIYIVAEGTVTEPLYVDQVRNLYEGDAFNLVMINHRKSKNSPKDLLRCMERYLKNVDVHALDMAFILLDRDSWTEDDFKLLNNWQLSNENYHVLISNPCFEYWLLLHFHPGNGVNNRDECLRQLKKCLGEYKKNTIIDLTREKIHQAMDRAKTRLQGQSFEDLVNNHDANSNVYLLFDAIEAFEK